MDDQNTTPQSDSQTSTSGSSNTSSKDDPEKWVTDRINEAYN
jgi:hypothetical protein